MHMLGSPDPRRGGALKGILLVFAVLLVVLVVGWIVFLPGIVKGKVTEITGFPVEASKISVNPFGTTVVINDFRLENPAEFPVRDFLGVRTLDLRLDAMSLRKEEVQIPQFTLDLDKLTIVVNQQGVTNLGTLQKNIDAALGESSETDDSPSKPFRIGVMQVRLGKVEMLDYSKGETPVSRVVELGVDRTFTDVTDPKVVLGPVLGDILKANLPGIANQLSAMLPPETAGALGSALQDAAGILGNKDATSEEKAKAASESAKKLFDSLKGDNKP
jgi:uncharacterized protein involved in outer membrane biogenesis